MPRYRNARTGVIVLVSDEQAEALGKGYVPADESVEVEPKKLTAAQKKAQAKAEAEESQEDE